MSIVIPVTDIRDHCEWMLRQLLESIVMGEYDDKVFIMYDGCKPDFIRQFEQDYPQFEHCFNPNICNKNLGFARNSNTGLRKAIEVGDEGCFLLNMDTLLPHSKYLAPIRTIKGFATPDQIDINPDRTPILDMNEAIGRLNTMAEKAGSLFTLPSVKFAGFCMWFSKEAFEKIGVLDEVFVATFEDDDTCVRACLAGLPVVTTNIPVHHYISKRDKEISTTGAYDHPRLRMSKIQFILKWKIPENIEHGEFNPWIIKNHRWQDRMKQV